RVRQSRTYVLAQCYDLPFPSANVTPDKRRRVDRFRVRPTGGPLREWITLRWATSSDNANDFPITLTTFGEEPAVVLPRGVGLTHSPVELLARLRHLRPVVLSGGDRKSTRLN